MPTPYNLDHPASSVKPTYSINLLFHNVLELKFFLGTVCNRTSNKRLRVMGSRYLAIKDLSILADDSQLNLATFDRVTGHSDRHLRKAWEVA